MSTDDALPFALTHQVRDKCMCLHLQRAARAVARHYDEALRPLNLTNGQFSLLMSLNRREAPSVGETSTLLGMDRTTITAALKPLERRGLLKVRNAAADKRNRLMTLTPGGRRLLAAAIPLWNRAQGQTGVVVGSDLAAFRAKLRAIASGEWAESRP